MSVVDDASLTVLALTNRLVDTGVSPLKASEFWRLLAQVEQLGGLSGLDAGAIADATAGTGLDADRLARLLDAGVGLASRLDELYEKGVSPVCVTDEQYPLRLRVRLGAAAPPVLYCAGDVSILAEDGIGMVGSRAVDADGAEVARKAAQQVAGHGLTVVSGGAKGVDQLSMNAAHEAGGNAVGVLADSLERSIGRADNRRTLIEGRACLCTPYHPDAPFTAANAMGRNKIIYGLSRATLVVASAKDEGGTWGGATQALKSKYGTVAVWMGPGAGLGNAALVERGGIPVEEPEAVLRLPAVEPADRSDPQMALDLGQAPPTDHT